jgi:hypothetical protein
VREEERGGKGREGGRTKWSAWWNGSSGWSGQRLQAPGRAISLANGSRRRHFACPLHRSNSRCGSLQSGCSNARKNLLGIWLARLPGELWCWSGNLGSGQAPYPDIGLRSSHRIWPIFIPPELDTDQTRIMGTDGKPLRQTHRRVGSCIQWHPSHG